jgi:hypothetical protein
MIIKFIVLSLKNGYNIYFSSLKNVIATYSVVMVFYNIIVSLLGLPASQSKKPSHFQRYFSNIAVSLLQASQSCLTMQW